jgi:uncharacterized protein (DUF1697 family)
MAGRHVALLRGINVGRAKRVAMADLRALVERLGYRDVATLLNSGNVAFTVPAGVRGDPAPRIEKAFNDRLGFSSRVTVLTAAELARIVGKNPLAGVADAPSRLLVFVLTNPEDLVKIAPLGRQSWAPEGFALGPRAAYVWCPEGVLKSRAAEALGRALGDATTSRNWATLTKLRALADQA